MGKPDTLSMDEEKRKLLIQNLNEIKRKLMSLSLTPQGLVTPQVIEILHTLVDTLKTLASHV